MPRKRVVESLTRDEKHRRGAGERNRRRLKADRLVDEERDDRADQDWDGADQLVAVLDRTGRIERHHVGTCSRLVRLEPRPINAVEQSGDRHEADRGDRREVDDEVQERQVGRAGYEDVRRVADERRRAADVGHDDLDDHQWNRVDVERVREQERDRDDKQNGGEVVEKGREHGGRHRERYDDRERSATRQLSSANRQPVVDTGCLGEPDHEHHPGQKPDRVEVDRRDRVLLVDRLGEQHQRRADQRHLGAVEALAGNRR